MGKSLNHYFSGFSGEVDFLVPSRFVQEMFPIMMLTDGNNQELVIEDEERAFRTGR